MGRGRHVGAASDFAAAGTSRHHYHSHNSYYTTMTDYNGEIMQGTVDETGVLHLVLNRAPVNAANAQLFFELGHYFSLAKGDPNVKAIVLSSAFPKYFTAGLDLKASNLKQGGSDVARDIASACDIRYCSSDAQFSIKEVDIGLAADIGTLQRLPKIIGNDSLARELAFTARPFSAEEAAKMGFVSRVFEGGHKDVVDSALATARVIASKSPVAVLGTKHLMNYSRDHTVAEGLHYTAIWNGSMIQSKDLEEAMGAFLKKKKPRFSKL